MYQTLRSCGLITFTLTVSCFQSEAIITSPQLKLLFRGSQRQFVIHMFINN